jgi:ELWxxDGT repeat protein
MYHRKQNRFSWGVCALLCAASMLLCSATSFSTSPAPLTTAWLVVDINPQPGVGSDPEYPGLMNGQLFFSADDPTYNVPGWHRYDIWQAGTTPDSARRVLTQSGRVIHAQFYPVFSGEGYVLFGGNADDCSQSGIFRSDGTPGGIQLILDTTGQINIPTMYKAINDSIVFFTDQLDQGTGERFHQVWRTNGQPGGAQVLARMPADSDILGYDANLWHGAVYFPVWLGTYQSQLWRTDGTPAGTYAVASVPGEFSWVKPMDPTPQLLFFYLGTANGIQLWQSDGTQAGTRVVTTVGQKWGDIDYYFKTQMASISDTLFFMALSGSDYKLMKTQGVTSGVEEVYNFGPLNYTEVGQSFVALNNAIYFCSGKGQDGLHVWRSDGTPETTHPVVQEADPYTGCNNLKALDGVLFFAASTPAAGEELWISQGTPASTHLLADVNTGTGGSAPNPLAYDDGKLWLLATVPQYGNELWALNYSVPSNYYYLPAIGKAGFVPHQR